jgi:hypothetical protein
MVPLFQGLVEIGYGIIHRLIQAFSRILLAQLVDFAQARKHGCIILYPEVNQAGHLINPGIHKLQHHFLATLHSSQQGGTVKVKIECDLQQPIHDIIRYLGGINPVTTADPSTVHRGK